jgi:hypothetical protein
MKYLSFPIGHSLDGKDGKSAKISWKISLESLAVVKGMAR